MTMTIWEIREAIAESGKMTMKDVLSYFKMRYPNADVKVVKSEAKEILSQMRKHL
jgi:hypothetical protein